MCIIVTLCKIVTATTFSRFVTVTEHVDIENKFKDPTPYFHSRCFVYESSSVGAALMPLTPCSYMYNMAYNNCEDILDYLTGDELVTRINETAENDRSLVRFDRSTQKYLFPTCSNCQAPKIVHRTYEFQSCTKKPSMDLVDQLINQLQEVEGLDKFGIVEPLDNIDRIGVASKRARSEDLSEDIPKGKKFDAKLTPGKLQQNIDVIDVFTVHVSDHLEKVKKTSDDRIKSLEALISSLDPKK